MRRTWLTVLLLVAPLSAQEGAELHARARQILASAAALPVGQQREAIHRELQDAASDPNARADLCNATLAELETAPNPRVEAAVAEMLCRAHYDSRLFDAALVAAKRWCEAATRADDLQHAARGYATQARTLLNLDRPGEARTAIIHALDEFETGEPTVHLANAYSVRATVEFRLGNYAEATARYRQAIAISKRLGNRAAEAKYWNNLGLVYKHLDDHEAARDALQHAHDTFLELGQERHRIATLGNLGATLSKLGEHAKALDMLRDALDYETEQGFGPATAMTRTQLGLALAESGDCKGALAELRIAIGQRRELGMVGAMDRALNDFGRVLLACGESSEALDVLIEARDRLGEAPGLLERDVCENLVRAFLAENRTIEARSAFDQYLNLDRAHSTTELSARHQELSSRLLVARQDHEIARLRSAQRIQDLEIDSGRMQVAMLIVGCALLVVLLGVAAWFMRTRSRLTRQLAVQNAQLESTLSGSIESERLYRHLFDETSVGRVLRAADDDRIVRANDVARELLAGDPGKSIEGRKFAELIPATARTGTDRRTCELTHGNTTCEVEIATTPVTVSNRELELITLRDVTDLRRLEEEQRRSQNLSSLSLLAAGIAHDFNNALTAITGNVSAARTMVDAPVDEVLRDAESAAVQAGLLTNQLLGFARGGSPLLANHALGSHLPAWCSFSAAGSATQIHVELAPDLHTAIYDEGQIGQVLQNLILNSRQAMGDEGSIAVRAHNVDIGRGDLPGLETGSYVRVAVRDYGPGIPPDVRDHIFTPYFTTKPDGRGLGLATSYAVVARHCGLLRLVPDTESGAEFELYLPATPEAPEATERATIAEGSAHGEVLVIDDDEMVRAVFVSMLRRLGYDVTDVRDGDAARQQLAAGRSFDVAVIDATIPGGLGGTRALRALHELDPQLPAVLTSGYSEHGELAHYRENGFSGMLKKPFQIDELASAVAEAIAPMRRS